MATEQTPDVMQSPDNAQTLVNGVGSHSTAAGFRHHLPQMPTSRNSKIAQSKASAKQELSEMGVNIHVEGTGKVVEMDSEMKNASIHDSPEKDEPPTEPTPPTKQVQDDQTKETTKQVEDDQTKEPATTLRSKRASRSVSDTTVAPVGPGGESLTPDKGGVSSASSVSPD
jgi:chromatin remodeling complex protein RSC6